MKKLAKLGICAALSGLALQASGTSALHLKVVAVRSDNGATVEDLGIGEWSIKVDGKAQTPISQRGPVEIANQPQSWVLVFLPIESPPMRKMALASALSFMNSLPRGDRVLVVVRNRKGMDCLTPGFTTRPTLWAKAIQLLITDLPAGLLGNSSDPMALPEAPPAEPVEGKEALAALGKVLAAAEFRRQPQDLGFRPPLVEQYPATSLGGFTESVKRALRGIEDLGEVIAKVPGEKQVVVWSRCEVDDLANPQWLSLRNSARMNEHNAPLQIDLMMKDVKVAQEHLKAHFARLGLIMHSIGGTSLNYSGAFADTAIATGGQHFRFEGTLPDRLSAVLGSWAAHYEVQVPVPQVQERPQKVEITTTRPGVRVMGPTLQ